MKYCFDIDGTICSTDESHDYELAKPFVDVIEQINKLYESNQIILFTARGASSGKNWHELTVSQLEKWGVKYHQLIDKNKPSFDLLIDDKAINAMEWRKTLPKKVGFLAGTFDILHPGYISMFKKTKDYCNYLVVGLHKDPSIERQIKTKPILSIEDRVEMILSLKYVDEVKVYETEEDLIKVIKDLKPSVRFLGNDYKSKHITGNELNIPIEFIDRNHGWSSTKFKKLVYDQVNNNKQLFL